MNKKQFWAAIDRARKAGGSWHGMYGPLQVGLFGLDVTDIITRYLILEKYRALAYIRDFLGHENIDTVRIYAYADNETISEALSKVNHES